MPADAGTISIIGGGWSVAGVDLDRVPGQVIAVNDSAMYAPRWDVGVSMDRLWTENRWSRLRELRKPFLIRDAALKNIPDRRWPWLSVFACDHRSPLFGESAYTLNGNNSGFCALNLAYVQRPKRVVLFGFDMKRNKEGRAYWFPDYPWARPGGGTGNGRYQEWARGFECARQAFAAIGAEVLNASPDSAIDVFKKVSPADLGCARKGSPKYGV